MRQIQQEDIRNRDPRFGIVASSAPPVYRFPQVSADGVADAPGAALSSAAAAADASAAAMAASVAADAESAAGEAPPPPSIGLGHDLID